MRAGKQLRSQGPIPTAEVPLYPEAMRQMVRQVAHAKKTQMERERMLRMQAVRICACTCPPAPLPPSALALRFHAQPR